MSVQSRSFVGIQKIDVSSSQTVSIKAQNNGVGADEPDCDMTIQNNGSTSIWVRFDSSNTAEGYELNSTGDTISFNGHTTEPGDVHLYFPDSSGGRADILLFE